MKKVPYADLPDENKKYKALYKGRRYWVFENDRANRYEGWQRTKTCCYMIEIAAQF